MNTLSADDLHQAAIACVESTGDVFWDFEPKRDTPLKFRDPYIIAVESVEQKLREVGADIVYGMGDVVALRSEYAAILSDVATSAGGSEIVFRMIEKADWTEQGARLVVMLARKYGVFVLRNALALAEAMGIEDGEAGL